MLMVSSSMLNQKIESILRDALSQIVFPDLNFSGDDLMHLTFQELQVDSLGLMEFCIAININLGFDINIEQCLEMGSPNAVMEYIKNA